MTTTPRIAITADSIAAYLIADLLADTMRDPAAFLSTYINDFDSDADHFADILITDEFDCCDDITFAFDAYDDARADALFALKSDATLFAIIADAIRRLAEIAPSLIPTTNAN